MRGRRVLDFGTGGGIAVLAATKAGASTVTANDVDPWALGVTRLAATSQGLCVATLLADLTREPDAVADQDVLLCADLGYERATAPAQRALLEHACEAGKTVIVADAGRTYFDADGLDLLATYEVDVPNDLEGVAMRTARVYEKIAKSGE
ncbi:MAG: class I SAM-dependent methyltransferase [Longimicrobiales bacterium]